MIIRLLGEKSAPLKMATVCRKGTLRLLFREVTLTTGGGGLQNPWAGLQNFGYLLWGDHKMLGTIYGGHHKTNSKDGIKIGISFFSIQNFRGCAAFLQVFTKYSHLSCRNMHGIVNTHDAFGN